jgi:hypothetical protein
MRCPISDPRPVSGGRPVSGVAHLSLPWRRIGFRVAPSRQGKDLPQFRITGITRNTAGNVLSNYRAYPDPNFVRL